MCGAAAAAVQVAVCWRFEADLRHKETGLRPMCNMYLTVHVLFRTFPLFYCRPRACRPGTPAQPCFPGPLPQPADRQPPCIRGGADRVQQPAAGKHTKAEPVCIHKVFQSHSNRSAEACMLVASPRLASSSPAVCTFTPVLQVNFAHNKLSGEVPATLQQLAAVRPVRVTMRDG